MLVTRDQPPVVLQPPDRELQRVFDSLSGIFTGYRAQLQLLGDFLDSPPASQRLARCRTMWSDGDGAIGVKRAKERGGLTIGQESQSRCVVAVVLDIRTTAGRSGTSTQ